MLHADQGNLPSTANIAPRSNLGPSLMQFLIHSGICHVLCMLSLERPSQRYLLSIFKVYPDFTTWVQLLAPRY